MASCTWASAPAAPPQSSASAAIIEDIRDIRGPKSLLAQEPVLPIVVVAAAFLLTAGYGLWRWRRKRVGGGALPPFELALQQLDRARVMMGTADAREFGGVVCDIVRRYIESQFDLAVTNRTTEEFMQGLMNSTGTPLAAQRPLLAQFLAQSDFVKFAGGSVPLRDLEALLHGARRLVQETAQTGTDRDSIPAT